MSVSAAAGTPTPIRAAGLFSAFAGLVSSQLLNTASGFIFWLLAARLASASEVGIAVATIGTIALVHKLAMLGIDTLVLIEVPRLGPGGARRLIRAGLAVVAALSAVLALALWLVVQVVVAGHSALQESLARPGDVALMAGILVLTSMGVVCDQAALGLGRARAQVARNAFASIGRFPAIVGLLMLGDLGSEQILLAWLVPLAASLVVFAFQIRLGLRTPRHERIPMRQLLRGHGRTSLGHFVLNLSVAAGPLLVPVVAAALLAPRDNAYFAIAWMVATVVFVPPYMLATALFASSAARGVGALARSARLSLPLGLLVSGVLALAAWAFGPFLLALFNGDYGVHSAHLLALLAPAGLWMVVKDHLVAWLRVEGRLRVAAGLAVLAAALELGAAVLGGLWDGATGLALLWLLSGPVEALLALPLIAAFLSVVRREGGRRGPGVMLTSALVDAPVEGAQVIAGQLARHVEATHGCLLLTAVSTEPPRDLSVEPVYAPADWVPVESLRQISDQNPRGIVFFPDGGLNARTMVHAVLAAGAGACPVDFVVLQRHRRVPRWVGRLLRRWIRMVVASESDLAALERSGFRARLITPRVDAARVSGQGRAEARAALGLPPAEWVALHVGHAREGRNLTALAPLASGGRLVIVASPFSPLEPTALPTGPGITVVHRRVDVATYYRAADVYVFPVTRPDHVIAYPMSIAEALANGLPVVARRTPMTERWADHPGVVLVDTDAALVEHAREAAVGAAAGTVEPDATGSPLSCCAAGCAL